MRLKHSCAILLFWQGKDRRGTASTTDSLAQMGQGSTARSSLVSFWNLEKTGARRCYPAQLCSEPRASMLRSPMSATLFRWEGWTDHAPMDQVQSQFDCLIML